MALADMPVRHCRGCRADVQTTGSHCPRGHFLPANTAALVHGGRSRQVKLGALPQQAEALAMIATHEAQLVADLGGPANVSTVARALIRRFVEVDLITDFVRTNILEQGVFTTKGRTRAAVSLLMQLADRQARLGQVLGIRREARPIASPLDFIEGRSDV
ncbi:MAG TPA: hypothetical protein VM364_04645 [Vicinamibacterales bacterium]|nr:hypothetical protein [Vicinamibacterales bacterium]